jgi:hypothetical protein
MVYKVPKKNRQFYKISEGILLEKVTFSLGGVAQYIIDPKETTKILDNIGSKSLHNLRGL